MSILDQGNSGYLTASASISESEIVDYLKRYMDGQDVESITFNHDASACEYDRMATPVFTCTLSVFRDSGSIEREDVEIERIESIVADMIRGDGHKVISLNIDYSSISRKASGRLIFQVPRQL